MRNNPNVPRGAKVLDEWSCMSGEIVYTVYEQGGKVYRVSDWKGDKPVELKEEEIKLRKLGLFGSGRIIAQKEDEEGDGFFCVVYNEPHKEYGEWAIFRYSGDISVMIVCEKDFTKREEMKENE